MFDFKAIQAALCTSFDYEVQDPLSKEPSGWVLELATPAHAGAQARVTAILDRLHKRKISTAAQDEKDSVDLICCRILGWRGLADGADEVTYSPEMAISLLSGAKSFWLRRQVVEAMGDTERPFTPQTRSSS
jgi:hypothetical protein